MNNLLLYLVAHISHILPDTRCFGIKRLLYHMCGVKVGKNVRICSSAKIIGNAPLIIGENVWIGHDTMIIASARVTIESHVNIAPRVYIGTGTHEIDTLGVSVAGGGKSLPVTIGEGAWICANSSIIAGVKIGKRSIVAAGAVVLHDVPDGELWGGVPAKKIRTL